MYMCHLFLCSVISQWTLRLSPFVGQFTSSLEVFLHQPHLFWFFQSFLYNPNRKSFGSNYMVENQSLKCLVFVISKIHTILKHSVLTRNLLGPEMHYYISFCLLHNHYFPLKILKIMCGDISWSKAINVIWMPAFCVYSICESMCSYVFVGDMCVCCVLCGCQTSMFTVFPITLDLILGDNLSLSEPGAHGWG